MGKDRRPSPPQRQRRAAGYGLTPADVEDVGQAVWLLLFQSLNTLRTPEALPGWLVTTTRN
jgi:DNA-directed RNA polymerase specialized sigma24 family protein